MVEEEGGQSIRGGGWSGRVVVMEVTDEVTQGGAKAEQGNPRISRGCLLSS